jgi:hypothetical protein
LKNLKKKRHLRFLSTLKKKKKKVFCQKKTKERKNKKTRSLDRLLVKGEGYMPHKDTTTKKKKKKEKKEKARGAFNAKASFVDVA